MNTVTRCALISRTVVWALAALAYAGGIASYDTSNDLENTSGEASEIGTSLVRHFSNWDGVHFTGIAERGYEYEHAYAFFPLLPALANVLGRPLVWAGIMNPRESIVLAAFVISNVSFVVSAHVLEQLGICVLGNSKSGRSTAKVAALLYCFTPASVFMSAFYTESVFGLFSFVGMLCAWRKRIYVASIIFTLAAATRSNGALLGGLYIGIPGLLRAVRKAVHLKKHSTPRTIVTRLSTFLRLIMPSVVCSALPLVPFALFQAHAGSVFCLDEPADRSWCDRSTYPLLLRLASKWTGAPLGMYSWIQSTYWGNGLFAYWQTKQIPNFLLAAPIVAFSCVGIRSSVRGNFATRYGRSSTTKPAVAELQYHAHWGLLLVVAVCTMNVQVVTRFLSACPPMYWFAASLFRERKDWKRRAVISYFLVYFVLGSVLFSRFYPWT